MLLTGYPTSCLTLAVTLVKTTRQQRETLPIAGFALDADKWSGTGSISAGTRAMIWSTPARSITASRRNQKRSCMTASGQTEKNSVRAYVFRFAPELGHCSTQSACLKRAINGSAQGEFCAIATYATCGKVNLPPSSIAWRRQGHGLGRDR